MPTDSEFDTLEKLVGIIKPLSFSNDALAGEKQVMWSDLNKICYDDVSKVLFFCGSMIQG